MTNNCTHDQECTRDNITGVHTCSCREGYNYNTDSESVCEGKFVLVLRNVDAIDLMIFLDIDECEVKSHNCSSENRQICNNTEGSFECVCESGYYNSLDAENCKGILWTNLHFTPYTICCIIVLI